MQFIRTNGRGILLCLILALPAWWLGSRFPVIGGPILAILLGMLVAIPVKDQGHQVYHQKSSPVGGHPAGLWPGPDRSAAHRQAVFAYHFVYDHGFSGHRLRSA